MISKRREKVLILSIGKDPSDNTHNSLGRVVGVLDTVQLCRGSRTLTMGRGPQLERMGYNAGNPRNNSAFDPLFKVERKQKMGCHSSRSGWDGTGGAEKKRQANHTCAMGLGD